MYSNLPPPLDGQIQTAVSILVYKASLVSILKDPNTTCSKYNDISLVISLYLIPALARLSPRTGFLVDSTMTIYIAFPYHIFGYSLRSQSTFNTLLHDVKDTSRYICRVPDDDVLVLEGAHVEAEDDLRPVGVHARQSVTVLPIRKYLSFDRTRLR
jgi:hypothetical protein